jgi:O-antigen ligase
MHAFVRTPPSASLLKPLAGMLLLLPIALFVARAPLAEPLLAGLGIVLVAVTAWNVEAGLVILIVSMLLSPELPLGAAGHGGLDLSRSVILRTEDVLLLLVGLGWLARMAIHKDLGAVRGTRLNAAIALYVACCLMSTLVGIGAGRVRPVAGLCFVAKYVEYFVIFFMTLNYVRTPERLRRLLAALLVTCAAITLYGWWQIPKGVRPSAPFEGATGEPNTLGGYLAMMTALAIALSLHAPSRTWRRACGLLAAAAVPVIAMTLSRSSWLGLAAAGLVLFALSPRRRILLAAAAVCAALMLLYLPAKVEQRLGYTFTPEGRDAVQIGRVHLDPSSSARLHSWGSALEGFARHPLTGYGITGYGFLDAQYFRVIVELGAFGALAFGMLLFGCGRLFFEVWKGAADPLYKALGLGLSAGFAALLMHAVGTNTFLLIRIMEPFWMLCALAAASLQMPALAEPAPSRFA